MVLNTELLNVPQGNNSQCIYSTATASCCQVWRQWRWRERGEREGESGERERK